MIIVGALVFVAGIYPAISGESDGMANPGIIFVGAIVMGLGSWIWKITRS